jgi:hypothetical protein
LNDDNASWSLREGRGRGAVGKTGAAAVAGRRGDKVMGVREMELLDSDVDSTADVNSGHLLERLKICVNKVEY